MPRKTIAIIVVAIAVTGVGIWLLSSNSNNGQALSDNDTQTKKITMYKSPSCGCCVEHAGYMEDNGYDVITKKVTDMSSIKEKYNIPSAMESCHTTIIDGYIVEGHVPIEAINKLLAEKPDIDGIALPDMPAGSPGMPGTKTGMFDIYALKDGQTSLFTSL